jgi:hypothetical protein
MHATWWSVLAALAPFADMCAPDELAPERKILEPARAQPVPPVTHAPPPVAEARPLLRACAAKDWPARFAGQLAGIAWVSFADGTATLTASAPGAAPTGPDPLPTLTVVRRTGTMQFADPRRTVHAPVAVKTKKAAARASVSLGFPLPAPWSDDHVAFVTTACLPNTSARLRVWTYTPLTPIAADFDRYRTKIDAHVRDSQGPGDRNAWERRGGLPPAGLGVFATGIPGCATLLTVNVDLATRLAHDFLSAVVCVGDDGELIDVLAPRRGRFLRWVGVADLDGDGVEEVALHSETHDRSGQFPQTSTDELLYASDGRLRSLVLSHVVHGAR